MSQTLITSAMSTNRALFQQQSLDAWAADQQMRGEKVALFRQYAEGDHPANLTAEMRKLLRISSTGSMDELTDNYMGVVIQTEADRLEVSQIESDNDVANEWIVQLLAINRFDGLQIDAHEAALRDGDTYLHVYYDNEAGQVRITHEPAYDGVSGVIVIHGERYSTRPDVAIKIWTGTTNSLGDTVYVTVYYPERIEKYISRGGALTRREVEGETWPAPWVMRDGSPIGVPFLHMRNRGTTFSEQGRSEIEDAIPLQNALNRNLYSMTMAAELTAFQMLYAIGFQPPADLTPGCWIKISPDAPLTADQRVELGTIEQGEIVPYLDQARHLVQEIYRVTNTPNPEQGGDNASGESLKQREIGLLGKVRRFQTKIGNVWEDLFDLAHRVQQAYGMSQPPAYEHLYCRWRSAEIRNDTGIVDNVLKVADRIGERETLRQLAGVFGWDNDRIEQILAERQEDAGRNLATLAGNIPGFAGATFGTTEQRGG